MEGELYFYLLLNLKLCGHQCLLLGIRCLLSFAFFLLSPVWGQGTVRDFRGVLESPDNFSGPKSCFMFVGRVCIQDQSFTNFENDTMKLSVNEAKLTSF